MSLYHYPPLSLLNTREQASEAGRAAYAEMLRQRLDEALQKFEFGAEVGQHAINPFAVILRIKPNLGESVKRLYAMREDIELVLGCTVEMVPTENGYVLLAAKSYTRPILPLRELLESKAFQKAESELTIAAGMNLLGNEFLIDLKQCGNLLVVGTTGSGKSTFISSLLISLFVKATPRQLRLLLIDPKMVELQPYSGIPHLLSPVITGNTETLLMLRWACNEAHERAIATREAHCGSFEEYLQTTDRTIHRIVIVIDEFMDLMQTSHDETESLIRQLTSYTLYSGVHLVMATQRPSRDVVSSAIKANIPCRAAFTVVDKRESRLAINRLGAERLLGYGDMIYSEHEDKEPLHVQAAFVSYEEIDRVADFLRGGTQNQKSSEV